MAKPVDFEGHSRNINLEMRQRERSNALLAWCVECERNGDPGHNHKMGVIAMLCTENNFQHNTYLWLLTILELYPSEHLFNDDGNCII